VRRQARKMLILRNLRMSTIGRIIKLAPRMKIPPSPLDKGGLKYKVLSRGNISVFSLKCKTKSPPVARSRRVPAFSLVFLPKFAYIEL
jgi:hypothetical protein